MLRKAVPFLLGTLVLYVCFFCSCKKDDIGLKTDDPNDTITDTIPEGIVADSLRINEIQVIGSHNSYRLKTDSAIYNFAQSLGGLLPGDLNPDGWDYEHLPLPEQFSDYGIRQIELDIYYDPTGGTYSNRMGNQLVSQPTASGITELDAPGFKVMHIVDLDYNTIYYTLKGALQAVKTWSEGHPNHLPIFILIEAKDLNLGDMIPIGTWTETPGFDATAFDALDQEIIDVFGEDLHNVITPDEVRGSFATLREAVTTRGWPKIGDSRGKVAFALDNGGTMADIYLQGHPSLQGRILFVDGTPGDDHAAFMKRNDADDAEIPQLVQQGFLVRTRSDSNTDEARSGDVTDRDLAFASGAQFISTDYYRPDPRAGTPGWTDYSVRLPGNAVARLNPVNGPSDFVGGNIE